MSAGKVDADKGRLDVVLVQRGLAESRERAQRMIMAGLVEVDRAVVDKPGKLVPLSSEIDIKEPYPPYVSRGGLKLEAALDRFALEVEGQAIVDVGASTGGFTDCLLQRGAGYVIAVDVGYGVVHWKLREDPRVKILERTNVRYLTPEDLGVFVDGAVIDVSFISLKLVIPPVSRLLKERAYILALVKPQFEVGRGRVGKGGVVRDPALHYQVITSIREFSEDLGWQVMGHMASPILGPKGNREFFLYLRR
ncbi:MAG: TlyA family RNA methyltransferase [Deltaproteobacteria bacterium]|nr:TlyA family RNA methyltransferase [Deltaproteobacteria bacterium]